MSVTVDMSKYDKPETMKLRAEIHELGADIARREYEYNLLISLYKDKKAEYDKLLGVDKNEK